MKSIYNITKGQYITLLIFGLILWFFVGTEAESYGSNGLWGVAAILIPFFLIFYSLGRKHYKQHQK